MQPSYGGNILIVSLSTCLIPNFHIWLASLFVDLKVAQSVQINYVYDYKKLAAQQFK